MAAENDYANYSVEFAFTDGSKKKVTLSPFATDTALTNTFKDNVIDFNADSDSYPRPAFIGTNATNQLRDGTSYPDNCPIISATVDYVKKTYIYQSETANLYAKKESED